MTKKAKLKTEFEAKWAAGESERAASAVRNTRWARR